MRGVKRVLVVCGALLILGLLVPVRLQPRSRVRNEKLKKAKSEANLNCLYSVVAFDGKGQPLSINSCLESNADLLAQLVSQSKAAVNDPNATAVVAISVMDRSANKLESLGLVADEFLTPRMDWRVMAERFADEPAASENNTINDIEIENTAEETQLLLDPTAYALAEGGTFADPFIAAIRTLCNDARARGSLQGNGGTTNTDSWMHFVDLILLRVLEEKLAAFADALRRFQFPEGNDQCKANLARTHGRTFIKYSGYQDFLGAMTDTNVRWLTGAIDMGYPFIKVSPVVWARAYHFDTCSAESVAAIDPRHCQ